MPEVTSGRADMPDMPEVTSGNADVSFLCSVLMLDTISWVGVGVCVTRPQDLSKHKALDDFSRVVVESWDCWTLRDMQALFWLPL